MRGKCKLQEILAIQSLSIIIESHIQEARSFISKYKTKALQLPVATETPTLLSVFHKDLSS